MKRQGWFVGPIKQIASASAALFSFFVGWVSADGDWSACIGEEMGISIAESVVMSEKLEFLEKTGR